MTKLDALKKFAEKLGVTFDGSEDTLAKALDKLGEEYEPQSGLPEVTAEDNGKVAKVVDGAWGIGEAGGGDTDIVVATFTKEPTSFDYISSVPYADLVSARTAGKAILAIVKDNPSGQEIYTLKNSFGNNLVFQHISVNVSDVEESESHITYSELKFNTAGAYREDVTIPITIGS